MFPCWYMPGYVYISVCLHVNDTLPRVHTLENGYVPVWLWMCLYVIAFDYVWLFVYKYMYAGVYEYVFSLFIGIYASVMLEKV